MTWILSLVFAIFSVSNLLIYSMNGIVPGAVAILAGAVLAGLVMTCIARAGTGLPAPEPLGAGTAWLIAALAAAVVLASGQAGHFYVNHDWQIRLPLLRDLANSAWPLGYSVDGVHHVLRAPLGMYALPALLGDVAGLPTSRAALALQNAAVLALGLGLVALIGRTGRERGVLIAVVLAFSGMDALGQTIVNLEKGGPFRFDHLEWWAGLQFSSTVTQLFWVPHHGLPGLIAAALYVLWLRDRLPAAALVAFVPLMAFWSPLAFLGSLPFAVHAMVRTAMDLPRLPWTVLAGAVASLAAIYAIAFLQAGTDNVHFHVGFVRSPTSTDRWPLFRYAAFLALEVLAFLAAVAMARSWRPAPPTAFVIVVAVLLACPVAWIGQGEDFVMRVSIPALYVLAILVAQVLAGAPAGPPARLLRPARTLAVTALAIGAITPLTEIRRAVTRPLGTVSAACTFVDAWKDSEWPMSQLATYLADETRFPAALRPNVATRLGSAVPPRPCMEGSWRRS